MLGDYAKTTNRYDSKAEKDQLVKLAAPTVVVPPPVKDGVDDIISRFRNVRIVTSRPINRSSKVWCAIVAWVWYYNDNPREERAGWCYVENVSISRILRLQDVISKLLHSQESSNLQVKAKT